MIISLDWLRDFVDFEESPKELAETLSNIGLEAKIKKDFSKVKNIVVGSINDITKHPNADKLKLCKINDGNQIFDVICGAPNVEIGKKVVFARINSVLPNNFKIKKAKIRGVYSYGMLCSEKELNIGEDHDGILILDDNFNNGDDFTKILKRKYSSIELDVTPNRPDALNHIGVARDLACIKNKKLQRPKINVTESSHIENKLFDVIIESGNDCNLYAGGIIRGVKVKKSPDWLVERLKSIGHKSINNIVDVSNYVMFECGHPTHIFDFDRISGNDIFVRKAKKQETLITLDEKTHLLNEQNLVIADKDKPVALAGVIGGFNSGVTNSTTSIFIESAYFNPITIRKSSKQSQILTDASKRFERGVDPEACLDSFNRVVDLIINIAGGKLVTDDHSSCIIKKQKKNIPFKKKNFEKIIGKKVQIKTTNKILKNLGFDVIKKHDSLLCKPPSFRVEIDREIDIIEEVARIIGFDSIKSDENIYGVYNYDSNDEEDSLDLLKSFIANLGFYQIFSNSFQGKYNISFFDNNSVPIINPLNKKMGFLRTSLLPGLIEASNNNIKNGLDSFRIFEVGKIHEKRNDSNLSDIIEKQFLALILYGYKYKDDIHDHNFQEDLFDLKGILISIFSNKFQIKIKFKNDDCEVFDHSQKILFNNKEVGRLGTISKKILNIMKAEDHIFIGCELDISSINNEYLINKPYTPIVVYPIIKRDLNFVIKEEQDTGPITDLIIKIGNGLIIDCKPVNIFRDENMIVRNCKSVSFTMVFQDVSKTLKDENVEPVIKKIISSANKHFNAKLRI